VVDPATIDKLIQRLDAQDNKIKEQDARIKEQDEVIKDLKGSHAESQPSATPTTGPVAAISTRLDKDESELSSVKDQLAAAVKATNEETTYPTLQFHGFGDVDYHTNNLKSDHNAFTLGELDVFVTSQISQDIGVLTETVLSADNTNTYGIEVERLLVQYHPNEYLNVDIGRYHDAIGYYNTAYHHGTWFQTAVGRPLPLNFEDSGGIIPVHQTGISAHGAIPWFSDLNLNWIAEIGNGRQYTSPTSGENQVGNTFDDNDYKALNFAFTSRPEALPGLQVGAGVYHDTVTANGVVTPKTDEVIIHAHAVYKNADWEILSEGEAIRHQPRGTPECWSSIGFVQVAHKFGLITPYARFTYFNGADKDPLYQILEQPGRHYGPAVGVRYDFSTFLALKAQYDYVVNTGPGYDLGPTFNNIPSGSYSQLTFQAAFTF
jgi:hypothetical protein